MNHVHSEWYVYVYCDPRKEVELLIDGVGFYAEPFYVGMGMNARMYDHLKHDVRAKSNVARHERISEIQADNKQPVIRQIMTGLTEQEARDMEANFIKKIGRTKEGGPLVNIRTGGEGGDRSTKEPAPVDPVQNAFVERLKEKMLNRGK